MGGHPAIPGKAPSAAQRDFFSRMFPNIGDFRVFNEADPNYNCAAFALLGATDRWLWPEKVGLSDEEAIQWVGELGWTICTPLEGSQQPMCDLAAGDVIVAYRKAGLGVVHFARFDRASRLWLSKCATLELIAHELTAFNPLYEIAFFAHREPKGGSGMNGKRLFVIDGSAKYRAPQEGKLYEEFRAAFEEWVAGLENPADPAQALLPGYPQSLPAYQRMVKMGSVALPFLIEKIASGTFHLNWAVQEITGIRPPESMRRLEGEQAVSRWLLKWWDERGQHRS